MTADGVSKSEEGEGEEELAIPLISLTPLLSHSTHLTTHPSQTARALLSAFQMSGFLYLQNHSIPSSLISRVFPLSAQFFALPQSRKDALAWTTPRANRGYVCLGREKVSEGMTVEDVARAREGEGGDLKESFEIGREGEAGCPNQWPGEGKEGDGDREGGFDARAFKEVMQEFFERGKEVHRILMRGIAIALGLDEGFFDSFVAVGDNTLRLLHYPPVPVKLFQQGRVRAGAHSDYGSVTLLFQDSRGGLQVEDPNGKGWVDVKPREGCVVVNAGDLLARWSNGLVRSTRHRVVEPPLLDGQGKGGDDEVIPARYSVAYFCNPDFERWIEALPGTYGGERGEKRWDGINSREYLVQRLTATY